MVTQEHSLAPPTPPSDAADDAEQFRVTLIRVGVLAWPVAAALKLAGQYGTFFSTGYGTDDRVAARVVSQVPYIAGIIGGGIVATVLGFFGTAALFLLLLPTPGRRAAAAAAAACVTGLAAVLPALGVVGYTLPRLGAAYLGGRIADFSLATGFFTFPWLAIFLGALLYPAGAITLGVLLARYTEVARAPAWLFGLSSMFLAFPLPVHSARVAGAILLLVAGVWIAISVRRTLGRGGAPGAGR